MPDNEMFLSDMLDKVSDSRIIGVACDRYRMNITRAALANCRIDEDLLIDRAIGAGIDGWSDLEMFREAVAEKHLRPGLNIALEHAISVAVVRRDSNGNSSLNKKKQRGRNDCLQAAIHAVGVGERVRKPSEFVRPFDVTDYVLGV